MSYPVLDPVSGAYPKVKGRLLTCYSPVRRSCTPEGALPLDLHVLSTPPAFVLSQDQTLHRKLETQQTTNLAFARINDLPKNNPNNKNCQGIQTNPSTIKHTVEFSNIRRACAGPRGPVAGQPTETYRVGLTSSTWIDALRPPVPGRTKPPPIRPSGRCCGGRSPRRTERYQCSPRSSQSGVRRVAPGDAVGTAKPSDHP